MRFLRRIAGIFGFGKDEPHEENEDDHHRSQQHNNHHNRGVDKGETRRPTQGFSVQVPIPVDRAPLGPVIAPSNFGDGGVQGLKWYAKRLRIDDDGDVADEFLDEVLPEVSKVPAASKYQRPLPKFEVKYSTRSARVKKQMVSPDGKIHQGVEYHGRLQWV